ncbi:Na+/H+ antiporter subunit E [Thioalkalicoccus limnaeus]|uniref:Na+/H+ antiporter subunit E n=1 Tax=Thioalkalicoccus limnaeus TaxID=120681 RepID=A0ABV4BGU5_9GAMM
MDYRLPDATLSTIIVRLVFFTAVWSIITGADPESWVFGIPSVLFATWVSLLLAPAHPRTLSPLGIMRFVPYFLWGSLRGGLDVAARVLGPRLRIKPGFYRYRVRLRSRAALVVFLDTLSLLPGTLGANLDDDQHAVIHSIDTSVDLEPSLKELERLVGDMFREDLTDDTDD